jgi:peptide/nickel transport system substrate-binding protein
MRKLRWQIVILLLTGLIIGVLLLGQQPVTITNQPVATPAPTSGGVYTEALIGGFSRLNPLLDQYNPSDQDIDRLIFSSLVRFDARGLPQGDLAESWGYSQDATLFTFTLRKNALWHDGKPVTADDVLFTIDLLRGDTSLIPADIRAFWQDVQVQKLSEDTLQFQLPEPFAPFMDYLTFGVLPKHLLGGLTFDQLVASPINLRPVGSGPYVFDRLISEGGQITGVALKANQKYWSNTAFIQQMIFLYYPDAPAALAAYQAGDVQGISRVTADILPAVLQETKLALYSGRQPNLTMIYLNTNNPDVPYLQDANFRRALLAGINRQWLIDHVLLGQGVLANGPMMPGTWAYYDDLAPVEYDLQAAQTALKAAGFTLAADSGQLMTKDNQPVAIQLLCPDDDAHKAMAGLIERQWGELGIKVTVDAKSYEELIVDRVETHNYQAALVEVNLSKSPDPDPYPFWDISQISGGQNYAGWENRNASDFLEQARVTVDLDERARLYRNFQVVFQKEMPALPLFYPVYSYAVDRQVQGVSLGPIYAPADRFNAVMNWYLLIKHAVDPAQTPTQTPAAP